MSWQLGLVHVEVDAASQCPRNLGNDDVGEHFLYFRQRCLAIRRNRPGTILWFFMNRLFSVGSSRRGRSPKWERLVLAFQLG